MHSYHSLTHLYMMIDRSSPYHSAITWIYRSSACNIVDGRSIVVKVICAIFNFRLKTSLYDFNQFALKKLKSLKDLHILVRLNLGLAISIYL